MRYFDPNYNPLLDEVETDYRKRVDQFVRDLAWGVLAGYWSPQLKLNEQRQVVAFTSDGPPIPKFNKRTVKYFKPRYEYGISKNLNKQFEAKWDLAIVPSMEDLWLWGYVEEGKNMLIMKAFDLLYSPSISPNVFISYRHNACSSSALALAIEARLKLLGNNDTFIDKTINAGDSIQERIDNGLDHCDVFVLLMDKEIFESKWTIYEYEKAISLGRKVIAIKHPDVTQDDLDTIVAQGFDMGKLFITCHSSGAIHYEKAINELLNALGYATY